MVDWTIGLQSYEFVLLTNRNFECCVQKKNEMKIWFKEVMNVMESTAKWILQLRKMYLQFKGRCCEVNEIVSHWKLEKGEFPHVF